MHAHRRLLSGVRGVQEVLISGIASQQWMWFSQNEQLGGYPIYRYLDFRKYVSGRVD